MDVFYLSSATNGLVVQERSNVDVKCSRSFHSNELVKRNKQYLNVKDKNYKIDIDLKLRADKLSKTETKGVG